MIFKFVRVLDVGLIVTIKADKVVTEELSARELGEIQQALVNQYKVPAGELKMETKYLTKGTLNIDAANLSDDQALDDLQKALANVLDVPEESVTLTVENGIVSYEIARDTFDEASATQSTLSQTNIADLINAEAETVVVSNVATDNDIVVEVTITVDVDDSTLSESDLEAMEATVVDFLEGYNYDNTEVTRNLFVKLWVLCFD